jgi:hypothetical protein
MEIRTKTQNRFNGLLLLMNLNNKWINSYNPQRRPSITQGINHGLWKHGKKEKIISTVSGRK